MKLFLHCVCQLVHWLHLVFHLRLSQLILLVAWTCCVRIIIQRMLLMNMRSIALSNLLSFADILRDLLMSSMLYFWIAPNEEIMMKYSFNFFLYTLLYFWTSSLYLSFFSLNIFVILLRCSPIFEHGQLNSTILMYFWSHTMMSCLSWLRLFLICFQSMFRVVFVLNFMLWPSLAFMYYITMFCVLLYLLVCLVLLFTFQFIFCASMSSQIVLKYGQCNIFFWYTCFKCL